MQYEYCSGAVLYTESQESIYYVLVVENDGHCGLPKGHIEFGETEAQAALREIKEETGITAKLAEGFQIAIEYPMENGTIKRTTYFCTQYENQALHDHARELLGVKLLPFHEALVSLSHPQVKDVLRQRRIIRQKEPSCQHIAFGRTVCA